MTIGIGLLGLGTVGAGVAQILASPEGRHPLVGELSLRRVAVRDRHRQRPVTLAPELIGEDPAAVVADPAVDIVVEVMGGLEPARSLILAAIEVPEEGGDTVFADATAVAPLLPEGLRAEAEAATCRHAYTFAGSLADDWNVTDAATTTLSQLQPMLWPVPGSEARALWVNKLTTVEVLGRSPAESREMMAAVRAPLYDEAIQYRHHWQPGDLVLWNNRTLQHARTPFDESLPRTLRRTPIN
jgi:alpha-ketoglutarate-dependent taurine dioxygenase